MSTILLENLTGVRVVRAFNSEKREEKRMGDSFAAYAETSIKANRRFANLDGLSFLFVNLFVIIVYWLSGGRISSGQLSDRRHYRRHRLCHDGALLPDDGPDGHPDHAPGPGVLRAGAGCAGTHA